MEMGSLQALFVALVSALGAYSAARAANKASVRNTDSNNRVEMEKEAYERARKLDTDTIARQDAEMEELRVENKRLREDNRALHEEILTLKDRLTKLEEEFGKQSSEELYDN